MAKTNKTTSQKHAELKMISKDCRDKLFRRLQLTEEILKDHEYVDSQFGSEARLIEILETDEWSEFASRPGLPVLLKLYRAFPDRRTWELYRYDWVAIAELLKEDSREPRPRTDWKAECQKRDLRIKELEAEVRVLRELMQEARS